MSAMLSATASQWKRRDQGVEVGARRRWNKSWVGGCGKPPRFVEREESHDK